MRVACWISKDTGTHSEYVILIALQQQQWLWKNVSLLRYTYIAYLVFTLHSRDNEGSSTWIHVVLRPSLWSQLSTDSKLSQITKHRSYAAAIFLPFVDRFGKEITLLENAKWTSADGLKRAENIKTYWLTLACEDYRGDKYHDLGEKQPLMDEKHLRFPRRSSLVLWLTLRHCLG
jgi:hypothetical protein